MPLSPLPLWHRLQRSLAAQAACCAVLTLLASLAGFRMGGSSSPHAGAASPRGDFSAVGHMALPSASSSFSQSATASGFASSAPPPASLTAGTSFFSQGTPPASGPTSPPPAGLQTSAAGEPTPIQRLATASLSSEFTAQQPPATSTPAPVDFKIPLVFRDANLAALNLTPQESAGIERLRSNFTSAVGQQNPADPGYADRWADAQPTADDKLRALLGWSRFNTYQIEAMRVK